MPTVPMASAPNKARSAATNSCSAGEINLKLGIFRIANGIWHVADRAPRMPAKPADDQMCASQRYHKNSSRNQTFASSMRLHQNQQWRSEMVVALSGSKTCARRDDNLPATAKRAAAILFTSIQACRSCINGLKHSHAALNDPW